MLCILLNIAPSYREGIYKEIDKSWKTEWYFGDNKTDIHGMDTSILSQVTLLQNSNVYGNWYWQKGALELAKSKKYSVYVITGEPYCLSTWILALCLRVFYPKKRFYFWTHGWYGKETKSVAFVKKIFFKLAHGIFLYGNYAKKLMTSEGFNSEKLFVIHNSLNYKKQVQIRQSIKPSDIYHNHFGNRNPVIIFIGRLTSVKKLDLLIEAVKLLNQEKVQVNIVLVGEGEEHTKLTELVHQNRLDNRVWFYGACYDEKKNAELLYNADICVAPGNVGLTAIHSMTFGTPVISHNDFKWQMPEFEAIRPGQTGDFFEKDDIQSLKRVISNWLNIHQNRNEVRNKCFKEIDLHWTPEFQMNVLKKNLDL